MLDYLEQWDKLNRAPTFDVASHNGLVVWQNDLVDLPGFHLNIPDASGEVWMEVERLRPIKPPTPPAGLLPWLLIPDDPAKEPRNRESLPNLEDPEKPLTFEDNPVLVSALAEYLSGSWAKWSASNGTKIRA